MSIVERVSVIAVVESMMPEKETEAASEEGRLVNRTAADPMGPMDPVGAAGLGRRKDRRVPSNALVNCVLRSMTLEPMRRYLQQRMTIRIMLVMPITRNVMTSCLWDANVGVEMGDKGWRSWNCPFSANVTCATESRVLNLEP